MSEEKKNLKIVIISYDMIPYTDNWGGSQRMYYLAQYLHESKIRATIFSIKKGVCNSYGNEICFNAIVRGTNIRFMDSFLQLKNSGGPGLNADNYSKRHQILSFLKKTVKQLPLAFKIIDYFDKMIFNEPGSFAGFISRAWIRSIRSELHDLIKRDEINVVIVSAPPFGLMSSLKGLRSAFPNLALIVDYRDPWNLWNGGNLITRALERHHLKYADLISFTNNELRKSMIKNYKIEERKTIVLENGFVYKKLNEDEYDQNQESAWWTISYVGVIDLSEHLKHTYRDFSQIFEAIKLLKSENKMVRLKIVGVSNPNNEYCLKLKRVLGENLELKGVVSASEAQREMRSSNALLLIHTADDASSKFIISGKFYDYILARRKILSIGSVVSLHKNLIESEALGVHCSNFCLDIKAAILKLMETGSSTHISQECIDVEKYSRRFHYKKFVNILADRFVRQ